MADQGMQHHSQAVLFEVQKERDYQDRKWDIAFDDKNTLNDWVVYITQYATNAARFGLSGAAGREQLVKVAALAVAAIEAHDRNGSWAKRHYD